MNGTCINCSDAATGNIKILLQRVGFDRKPYPSPWSGSLIFPVIESEQLIEVYVGPVEYTQENTDSKVKLKCSALEKIGEDQRPPRLAPEPRRSPILSPRLKSLNIAPSLLFRSNPTYDIFYCQNVEPRFFVLGAPSAGLNIGSAH